MGLLDFLRRRADGPDAAAPEAVGPVEAGSGSGDETGSGSVVALGAGAGGAGAGGEGVGGAVPDGAPAVVPPAWSLLPPLLPLSHQPIHRTFDTGMSASLRAHRRADQLLATAPLGHTVDPAGSGVVHGLLEATGADPVAPMTAGPDLVLRRKVLTPAELPDADRAHPRWPTWVYAAGASSIGSTSGSTSAAVGPVARWADTDGAHTGGAHTGGADAGSGVTAAGTGSGPEQQAGDGVDTGGEILVSSTMPVNLPMPDLGAGGADAAETATPTRSLPPVSAAPVAPTVGSRPLLTRLADPAARSLDRAPARTADLGPGTTTAAAPADTAALPLVASADPLPAAGPSPRVAGPVQPSAVLRRRGIVEVPARRSPADTAEPTGAVDAPPTGTVSRAADDSTAPVEPSVPPLDSVATAPDGTGPVDGPVIARAVDPGSALRPTLGRGGLGRPLSALPPTAVRRDADDDGSTGDDGSAGDDGSGGPAGDSSPFTAAIGAEAGALPLRRSADPDTDPDTGTATGTDPDTDEWGSAGNPVGRSAPEAGGPGLALLPVVATAVSRQVADGAPDGVPAGPAGGGSAAVGSGPAGVAETVVLGTLGDRPIVSSAVMRAPSVLAGAEPAATVVVPVRRGPEAPAPPPGSPGSAGSSGSVMRRIDASAAGSGGPGSVGGGSAGGGSVGGGSVGGGSVGGGSVGGATGPGPRASGGAGWAAQAPGDATTAVVLSRLADPTGPFPGHGGPQGESGPSSAAFEGPSDGSFAGADGSVGVPVRRLPATAGGSAASSSSAAATPAVLPVVQRIAAPTGPIAFAPGLAPTYSIRSSWDGDRSDSSGGASGDGSGGGSGPGGLDGGSGPYLQRSADSGTAPEGGEAATENPAAAAVQSPSGASAGGSTAQAESDLDLLAGRLYDRIRFRLRRELLDDRERAGLVLDRMR